MDVTTKIKDIGDLNIMIKMWGVEFRFAERDLGMTFDIVNM